MKRLVVMLGLIMLVLSFMVNAQQTNDWYLELCRPNGTPYGECRGIKIVGFELDEQNWTLRPNSKEMKVEQEYLMYVTEQVKDGQVQIVPDRYDGWEILNVYWGDRVLTKVAPTQLNDCGRCWSEGEDRDGKRTLVFSLKGWENGLRMAVIVHWVRVKGR